MKGFQKRSIFLMILFVAVLSATIWFDSREGVGDAQGEDPGQESLPKISIDYGGQRINYSRGYTTSMEGAYMHGAITPLPEDRNLKIYVEPNGNGVTGAQFEVWSSGMERLVEQSQAELSRLEDGYLLSCPLQNLLEEGKEYILILTLTTDLHPQVYYYTRIWYGDQTHQQEMLQFAQDFSSRTFDKEAAQSLVPYLESDNTQSNQSLGNVNIHSSFAQITWGDLAVEKTGNTYLTIAEINDTYGSYLFTYEVSVSNGDTVDRYQVTEAFTIRWSEVRCYLMAYDRTMNQEFPSSGSYVGTDYVDFGIQSEGSVQAQKSPGGVYSFFVLNGQLWRYDAGENELTCIFSLSRSEEGGLEHDIRIISADDEGNGRFLVYGYMGQGIHEGTAGMAFYQYDGKTNQVTEVFFLASTRPYQVMKEEIRQFFYAGDNNLLYWMYGNSIYAIDFTGSEFLSVVNQIKPDQLVMSGDNSAIAWQTGGSDAFGSEIQVLYLSDGQKQTITAPEGEQIKGIGFLGEDFVYGLAKDEDISDPSSGPMYALEIVGKDGTVQGRYEYDGIYITDAQVVDDSRLNLTRAVKDPSGQLSQTSSDTLIQSSADQTEPETLVYTASSGAKQTVYRLKLSSEGRGENPKVNSVTEVSADSSNTLSMSNPEGAEDGRYYAYAKGQLINISYTIKDGVAAVTEEMGTVTDGKGRTVWTRYTRPAQKELAFTEYATAADPQGAYTACLQMMIQIGGGMGNASELSAQTESFYEALNEAFDGRAVDVSGLTISQLIACYLPQGMPVMGILNGSPVLIVGYDAFNVTLYDPVLGSTYKMGQDTANTSFEAGDSQFFTFIQAQ